VLILTDLHLGDRSGLELIAANEASARPVPIITMSGPTVGESAVDPGTRASVKAHLHKPFTIAALERAMGFLTRD
jgi:DNA-binding response OmpR family regulator